MSLNLLCQGIHVWSLHCPHNVGVGGSVWMWHCRQVVILGYGMVVEVVMNVYICHWFFTMLTYHRVALSWKISYIWSCCALFWMETSVSRRNCSSATSTWVLDICRGGVCYVMIWVDVLLRVTVTQCVWAYLCILCLGVYLVIIYWLQ